MNKIAYLQTTMEIEMNKQSKEILYLAQSESLLKMMAKSSTDTMLLSNDSLAIVKKWQ